MENDMYGMEVFPLSLGDKEFDVFVARDEQSRRLGLSGQETLGPDEGMLFVFPGPGNHKMYMKGTNFPLDIIFLNENVEVLEILEGKANDETLLGPHEQTSYVLELPSGAAEQYDLQPGDRIDDIPDEMRKSLDGKKETPLKVLGNSGEIQAELEGGERIFSRNATRKMIKAATESNDDDSYIKLARIVVEEVIAQDERNPEFTGEGQVTYKKGKNGEVKKEG